MKSSARFDARSAVGDDGQGYFSCELFFLMVIQFKNARSARLQLAVLPLALLTALPALAQTQLKEVVVTASLLEQSVQNALPSTSVITRKDIEQSQAADLPTLLRNTTGLEIAQNGGTGTLSSVFTRGTNSTHTLVLIDGVPVNSLNFGLPALEHMALSNVDHIEVVRGNASAIYGSAALGGVIQIFTREASNKPFVNLSAEVGPNQFSQLQLGGGLKTDSGTGLTFTAENIDTKGFNATNQSEISGTNPDRDGYSRRAYSVGITQEFDFGKISLTGRESSGITQYDSQYGPANQADESKFAEQGMALAGQFKLPHDVQLDLSLSQSADKLQADTTAYPYWVNSDAIVESVGLRWKFSPGQNITTGYEITDQKIASDTVYVKNSRNADTFRVGYQGEFEKHQVQLNIRQDQYSDFGTASTWYAGYAYLPTEQWRVSVTASTGFRAPTFNDLYDPFTGNANLRPEKLDSTELGIQYTNGTHQLRATVFDNRFTDLIASSAPTYVSENVNKARNTGIEISYHGKFDATSLQAGLTVQNPIDEATQKRLVRRAGTIANVGITHDQGPWTYGANWRYSDERPDGTQTLQSYSVVDVTISRALQRKVKVYGRIENLMDTRYETAYGYNQPRQGVFVGVSWQPAL